MQTGTESIGAGSEEIRDQELEDAGTLDNEKPAKEDPLKNESPRQTIERIANELEKEASEGKDGDSGKEDKEKKPVEDKDSKDPDFDPNSNGISKEPPSALNAKSKEMFAKLPKDLRDEVNRIIKESNTKFTTSQQEISRLKQGLEQEVAQVRHLTEAIRPLREQWGMKGLTDTQAILGLAASQTKLASNDPEKKVNEYVRIGRTLGVDFDALANYVKGGQKTSAANPEFNNLFNEVKSLKEQLAAKEKAETESALKAEEARIEREINALFNEKDNFGKYVYPEFHDSGFRKSAEELALGLVRAIPTISEVDAFKLAYRQLKGDSTPANPARLQNETKTSARDAAVSVRGNSRATSTPSNLDEIPEKYLATPKATLEYFAKKLSSGV